MRPWALLAVVALVTGMLAMHTGMRMAGPPGTAVEASSATAALVVQPPPPADPAGCPCVADCGDMSACQAITDRAWSPADLVVPVLDGAAGVAPDVGDAGSAARTSGRPTAGLTVTTVAVTRI